MAAPQPSAEARKWRHTHRMTARVAEAAAAGARMVVSANAPGGGSFQFLMRHDLLFFAADSYTDK